MTTTVKALGGGAQPASIDTSGKVAGGAALRVYGFDNEADAIAAGYVCEGGPAMSVSLITDAQIASGAWKAEGDPAALVVYTAPSNMPVEGGYALPVYPVNGWGSAAPAPVPPLFDSAEIGTVNASTVAVTFDQDVSAADYKAGVTIKVNGSGASISSATRQVNHAIVYYVIPVLWHGSGDTVTWEYASGSGNIVAESDSTPLGDVSAQSVTNNCEYVGILDVQMDAAITSTAGYAGSGTITQSGITIAGVGTKFMTELFYLYDRITAAGIDGIVTNIYSDTEAELDTSATVAVGVPYTITPQNDSARLVSVADQSGNGHTFNASTPAPVINSGLFDSTPSMIVTGVGVNAEDGNFADDLDSFTAIIAVTTLEAASDVLIGKISDLGVGAGWECDNGQFVVQEAGGANYSQATNLTYPATNCIRTYECISRSNLNLYVNSDNSAQSVHSGTFSTHGNNLTVKIGWLNDGISDFFGGGIHAVMLYSPIPNATNRAALEVRLAARYGITI